MLVYFPSESNDAGGMGMMAKAETKVVATRVSVELWRKIQYRALDEQRSVQEIVGEALTAYLKHPRSKRERQQRKR
jgi:hypothetical protein